MGKKWKRIVRAAANVATGGAFSIGEAAKNLVEGKSASEAIQNVVADQIAPMGIGGAAMETMRGIAESKMEDLGQTLDVGLAPKAPNKDEVARATDADMLAREKLRKGKASTMLTGGVGIAGKASTSRRTLLGF